MSHLDPFHLQQLVQHFMSSQPYGPDRRIEPEMGTPPVVAEDPSRARTGQSGGLDAFQMPQRPTTQAQKKAAANAQRARDEGVKGVADALRPGAIEPDASVEPAISRGPLGPGIDDAAKEAWVNNMRRLRDAARERTKPPPPLAEHLKPYEYLIGQRPFVQDENGNEIPTPAISADNLETYLRTGRTDGGPRAGPTPENVPELTRDPLAKSAGEDAVRKALTDINMKPLIEQALQQQAIRDLIASHITEDAANFPEHLIPGNENFPPGLNYSKYIIPEFPPVDPNTLRSTPGGQIPDLTGSPHVLDPLSTIPRMPPPANLPLFPPQGPRDPNLPQGPHVRSPGKPEDETPPVE